MFMLDTFALLDFDKKIWVHRQSGTIHDENRRITKYFDVENIFRAFRGAEYTGYSSEIIQVIRHNLRQNKNVLQMVKKKV